MKLFFRDLGNGKPLIIAHGLWGASDNWLPIAHLLENQFRVILPDARNHGQSPHSATMNYEAMSDDLIELIGDLHLSEKPSIVGHSMGGKIVMALLLKRPEIVDKAVIVDIAPIAYSAKDGGQHNKVIHFMQTFNPADYDSWAGLREAIGQHFHSERGRQLFLKNIRRTPQGFQWKINYPVIATHFDEISGCPGSLPHATYDREILFLKGEHSNLIPDLACLQKQFPAARLLQIPRCGHWIHAEQPEMLAEAIRKHC